MTNELKKQSQAVPSWILAIIGSRGVGVALLLSIFVGVPGLGEAAEPTFCDCGMRFESGDQGSLGGEKCEGTWIISECNRVLIATAVCHSDTICPPRDYFQASGVSDWEVTTWPGIVWSIVVTDFDSCTSSLRIEAQGPLEDIPCGTIQVSAHNNGVTKHGTVHLAIRGSCTEKGGCPATGFRCISSSGDVSSMIGSVRVNVGLGRVAFGKTAGALSICETAPMSSLAKPTCLKYNYETNFTGCHVLTNINGIYQIKGEECLAQIVTNTPYRYTIQIYSMTNVLGIVGGYYQVTNSPLRQIIVENPDTTGASSNKLYITDGEGYVSKFEWLTDHWELYKGDNRLKNCRVTGWSEGDTLLTSTSDIKNELDALIFWNQQKYRKYDFGTFLTEQTRGSAGDARTDTYSYYTTGDYVTGVVQQVLYANGPWEIYRYETNRFQTNRYLALLNEGPTTNGALCRSIAYRYGSNVVAGSGDSGHLDRSAPRCTIEYFKGNEVSRSYLVLLRGERRDIRCLYPEAPWNTNNNLVTITKYYTNGLNAEKLRSIEYPDGTMEIYEYSYGTNGSSVFKTNTISKGQPNGGKTAIADGEQVINVVGGSGQQVSRVTLDLPSEITTSSQTYSDYDGYNRPRKVTYLDGTFDWTEYGCCGFLNQTNREGTFIENKMDELKRIAARIENSITTTNIFDAKGNLLQTIRIGSDGSKITNSTHTYNTAGIRTSTCDALGNTNRFIEVILSNQLIRTNIFPDGGTRVETYYRDGQLAKVSGTGVHPVRYLYDVADVGGGLWHTYSVEIKLDGDGADTVETVTNWFDMLGRNYKTTFAGGAVRQTIYAANGQRATEIDPDGVRTDYVYNGEGEVEYTVVDVNRNGAIEYLGTDRIERTASVVANNGTANVRQTTTYVWPTWGSGVSNAITVSESSTDGLQSWQTSFGTTRQARTLYAGTGTRYLTNIAADGSLVVSHYLHGRLQSVTRKLGTTQLSQTSYTYDAHGRLATATDARNGTTTYGYNNADQRISVTTPLPGTGQGRQTTTSAFDSMGRVVRTVHPDGTTTTNEYHLTGELKKTAGSRSYPIEYKYDAQGRMTNMITWRDYPNSGSAVTSWIYDAHRGFLTNKLYSGDTNNIVYTYTKAGRLRTRTWQRGITTTYETNAAGDTIGMSYSSGAANVTYNLDRRGRRTNIVDDLGSRLLTYSDSGLLLSEKHVSGDLNGLWITNRYDDLLRRTNVAFFTNGSSPVLSYAYAYDGASRMTNVSDGTYGAGYSYLANSSLLDQTFFRSNTTVRLTTSRSYDYLNRLRQISSTNTATALNYSYTYNEANQRIRTSQSDGSYWLYDYDELGQVISGKRYWADGTPVAGQQFEYAFDDIGNRTSTKAGGDEEGQNLRPASYSVNALNQYTSRDVPGAADIMGIAHAQATVTVNGQSPYRKGEYFRKELATNNSSASVYTSVTNLAYASGVTNTNIGSVFLPKTAELFSYDTDGNQTGNGRWTNRWDAENRLIEMESIASVPSAAKRKLVFKYDDQGRRVSKIVSNWTGSAWALSYERRFIYDRWNLLAELDGGSNTLRSFVWGLDLSGREQGAGGVGGLLAIKDANQGIHFVAYDGNGNVGGLTKATDGTLSARYEYDSFGRTLRVSGTSIATNNLIRFSSKYTDLETGWNYYGYRYYDSDSGRWPNRDPILEEGGENLYCILNNRVVNKFELLGLCVGPSCASSPGVPGNAAATGAEATSPETAKSLCQATIDRVKKEGGPSLIPPDGKFVCKNDCESTVKSLKNDIVMAGWFAKFDQKCPVPTIVCKPCRGAGGWYDSNAKTITICHKEGDFVGVLDFRATLTHELIHALQDCYGDNRGCLASLKREAEAYYCAEAGAANKNLSAAIESSCGTLPSQCTPQEVANLFDQLTDWYNKEAGNFCSFPRKPEYPGK